MSRNAECRALSQSRPGYDFAKRFLDVIFAAVGIIVLAPVFLLIALAVRVTSPGDIFYLGERAGRFGKPFGIVKFRSMIAGAESGAGTTSRNDPRVTPVGRFIRKYKLDELPQLWNVLCGEMSIVGPRPELLRYVSRYRGEENLILTVRPGITDYASIHFSDLSSMISDDDPDRSFENTVLAEKMRLRVKYVKERGFWLDLRLICATLAKVFGARWR